MSRRPSSTVETPSNGASETEPLLSSSSERVDIATASPFSSTWIIVIVCLILITLGGGDQLMTAPETRLFEAIICRTYYESHDPGSIGRDGWVPELLCKIEPVESEVALLLGWQTFFDCLPSKFLTGTFSKAASPAETQVDITLGLFLAVPYGWLADNYGRRPIIIVSMVSFWVRAALIMVICEFIILAMWSISIHTFHRCAITTAMTPSKSYTYSKDRRQIQPPKLYLSWKTYVRVKLSSTAICHRQIQRCSKH
jgi:hypothetical protein